MAEENDFAILRKELALLPVVSRTWFEWDWGEDAKGFSRVLVVEVNCDTDPNSIGCDRNGIEDIAETVRSVLTHQTTMTITGLRIVPKQPPQFVPPSVAIL